MFPVEHVIKQTENFVVAVKTILTTSLGILFITFGCVSEITSVDLEQ